MMKKSITLLIIALLSLHTTAKEVSGSEAFDIASKFMAKKGITLKKNPNTRSNTDYTLFSGEDGVGYAAVMNGRVVAYSTEESSDRFTLMCSKTRTFELTPKYPIKPMIDCEYGQFFSPFIDMTPMMENEEGELVHCPVGCGPLAVAIIMYYYKNPGCEAIPAQDFGSGYPKLEALPATTFNWDLIRSSYDEGDNYTKEEAEEVAKLMKYAGYAFEGRYRYYSCGSFLRTERFKLLGFSDETYTTLNDYWNSIIGSWTWFDAFDEWKISDEELEATLDGALEKGRPALLAGYDWESKVGHWFVIDGRDDTGMYHVQGSGYRIISQEMYMDSIEIRSMGFVKDPYVLDLLYKVWLVVPVMPEGWTGIENAKADKTNDGIIYNLQGQKVGESLEGLPKGIYIKDGKKQVVK